MASKLVDYLEREMDRHGWKKIDLARKAGLPPTTLYRIFDNPDKTPELDTLDALARGLGVSLKVLVEACGFPVEEIRDWKAEVQLILSVMPEFRDFLPEMAALSPEDRSAVLAIARAHVSLMKASKDRR